MADRQAKGAAVAERRASPDGSAPVTREQLIGLLNEDLAR